MQGPFTSHLGFLVFNKFPKGFKSPLNKLTASIAYQKLKNNIR